MRKLVLLCAVVATALLAAAMLTAAAWAHVTVQPTEALPGSFARFAVRVPNERPDAATVTVSVRFPDTVTNASFQPKAGWTRTVTMKTLDTPIEVFGEPVTEVIDTVTWEGGRIEPGEFEEFAFSIRTSDEPGTLLFPAVQTYSSGEEVRWIGEPDDDQPAARVQLVALDAPEGSGQLAVLAGLQEQAAGDASDDGAEAGAGGTGLLGAGLGGLGAVLGALALVVASRKR